MDYVGKVGGEMFLGVIGFFFFVVVFFEISFIDVVVFIFFLCV